MIQSKVHELAFPATFAARTPEKPAVIMGTSGRTLTYQGLEDHSNQVAHLLADAGLAYGDHIALLVDNCPEILEIMWAAQRSGLYFTPINTRLTAREVAYVVADCAKAIFVSKSVAQTATELIELTPHLDLRISVGGSVTDHLAYESVLTEFPADPIPGAFEGAAMAYSSGTTGRPKGIMRPMTGLLAGHAPYGNKFLTEDRLGWSETTVYLSPAPLHHTSPFAWSMATHRVGGTVVQMERFDALEALALIERHQINRTQLVPTMMARIMKLPIASRDRFDLSSLEVVVHAAAPCPPDVKRAMIEWLGPIVYEFYSMSEGLGATFITSEEWMTHPGSVGRVVMGELHILNEDKHEVPAGDDGVLWFGGEAAALLSDQIASPDIEASARAPESATNDPAEHWATVGDVGHIDQNGYVYLTDRISNMIVSGGVNIYPQEAENVLIGHPAVHDAAVIGVPNTDLGEEVKAVVVLADTGLSRSETEALLLAYCREHMATYKCPRSIDFVGELPRQENGKLYKRLLKDQYWAGRATRIV